MNQQFTDKHLTSLASIMLLAPAVQLMLKGNNIQLQNDELDFVRSYIRYGYYILAVLGAALLIRGIYSFLTPLTLLYRANYGLLGLAIAMILYGMFSITNNKTIITAPGAAAVTETNASPSALIYFLPLYNYYLWYNEPAEGAAQTQLKESVLLWTLYVILISIWPLPAVMLIGAVCIFIRALTYMLGADANGSLINRIFHTSPEELIAYPLGVISHSLKKIFQRPSTLAGEVESRKVSYGPIDPVNKARTIIQYVLALAALGYRGYMSRLTAGPTVGISIALLPQIMLLGKILMTLPSGKLPRVPVLYTLLGGKQDPIAISK